MIKAIEPLGRHDRAAFSCGVAALDDWFHLRAGQDEKRNVTRVFVAIDEQHRIVGFYSLSSFTLTIADLPPEYSKHLLRHDLIPAALIGRGWLSEQPCAYSKCNLGWPDSTFSHRVAFRKNMSNYKGTILNRRFKCQSEAVVCHAC